MPKPHCILLCCPIVDAGVLCDVSARQTPDGQNFRVQYYNISHNDIVVLGRTTPDIISLLLVNSNSKYKRCTEVLHSVSSAKVCSVK